jgi:hypothetical protein
VAVRLRDLFIQTSGEPRPSPGKIEARIAHLPTHELTPWAEQCLYGIGRCLSEYTKDPVLRQDFLDEAVASAEVLVRLITELRSRNVLGPPQ